MSRRSGRSSSPVKGGQKPTQAKSAQPKTAVTNAEALAAQEAKREARMERQMVARAEAERRRRMRGLRNIGISAAIFLVIAGSGLAYFVNEANKPGQGVPQEPSTHIQNVSDPHAPYNSDPPTSGPHTKEVPSWGVHTDSVAKELQVHALEDAGVVINYRPDLDKATVDRLAELTRSYDKDVLMAPYPGLSNPIVLTAWTRIDRLDNFDEVRIKRFINAFKGIDHHKDSGS